jgi:hypothetical protein
MESTRTSRRLPPDAYDHLWNLLPLQMVFTFYLLLNLLADKVG